MEAAWIYEYRRETNRTKRYDILTGVEKEHPEDDSIEIRKKLWNARYDKKNGYDVDYFIRGFITLQSMKRRIYLPGEKKRLKKEIASIKKDWQFELCGSFGENGKSALYDELYNMTLLYIGLCRKDKTYNSVLWGLGHISESKQTGKIIEEICETAQDIPEKFDAVKELEPFTKAAMDALRFSYPNETV